MTFQSSFLIRCRLHSEAGIETVTAYFIQHVQTGDEFRSSDLAETTEWMAAQNKGYLNRFLNESASREPGRSQGDTAEDEQ